MRAGNFVGAIEAAATGFGRADQETAPPAAPPAAPATPTRPVDFGPIVAFVGSVLFLILVVGVIWVVGKFGYDIYAKRRTLAEQKAKMQQLADDAQRTLMDADEEVRTGERDYQFAEAEYGADEVATFKSALALAKEYLTKAFKVGQLIDDDIPESYEERASMFREIAGYTESIKEGLGGEQEKIANLREMESTAAATVADLIKGAPQREKDVAAAGKVLTRLNLNAKSVVEAVAHNVNLAQELHSVADADLAEAQKAVDAGKLAPAALKARTASEALAKAKSSLAAVLNMGELLDKAQRTVEAEVKAAAADIAAAGAALKKGRVSGVKGQLDVAQNRLDAAVRELADEQPDFIRAYKAATEANSMADEVMQDIRDAEERQAQAERQARQALQTAEVAIAQADAYIENHRSSVGRKARNRLSEAQRKYQEARGTSDIFAGAAAATIANNYANEAYRHARTDVNPPPPPPSYSSSGYGSSSSSSSGGD